MKKTILFLLLAISAFGFSAFSVAKKSLLPDLTIESVSHDCQKAELYITVKNIGKGPSIATQFMTFGRSAEALPCLPNHLNHLDNLPSIAAGAATVVTVKLVLNRACACLGNLAPKYLHYAFQIDPNQLVHESDKSNNVLPNQSFYIYNTER